MKSAVRLWSAAFAEEEEKKRSQLLFSTSTSSLSPQKKRPTPQPAPSLPDDDPAREPIDPREVFDHVRAIADPEHPYSLEQLGVVSEGAIAVDDAAGAVALEFTPTVAHCSMATLIGLCLRVRLAQALPRRFKVDVTIAAGKHSQEDDVNRQLADKERVAAALENPGLRSLVAKCLAGV
jgi:metal-sulfur cluster biosynthetic enzyme